MFGVVLDVMDGKIGNVYCICGFIAMPDDNLIYTGFHVYDISQISNTIQLF